MRTIRFVLKSLFVFLGIIYLLYVSYVYVNQEEMIFVASKLPNDYHFEFNQKFEELNIPSFDGKKLNGLLFTTPNPKGLIFYLHGNAGALDTWGTNAKVYTDLGYDCFILDYRGYGKSEGIIENQEQFLEDVSFAYTNLAKRYDKNKIVIIGYSIGTGPATYLASKEKSKALILQAPYYNFKEFSSGVAPYIPDFLKKFTFDTNAYIVKVKAPVYIFHGKEDHLIPYSNAMRLQKLLKPSDRLFLLSGQDHLGMNGNTDFQAKLATILSH